ncbi:MAG: hypothetical protein KGJ94_02840, partial [Xanthomonadaceae bacterium]|nr:hypothetical protein [Xanthomonadaceae bacterium]
MFSLAASGLQPSATVVSRAMPSIRPFGLALALALLAVCATAIAAAPLPAFTAHYLLLRDGSQIGIATMTLARAGDDTWTFTTQSRGTS